MEEVESIVINVEVNVQQEDGVATVTIAPELRITERLVSFLNDALKARDLELKHWVLSVSDQEKELENLPNVMVESKE